MNERLMRAVEARRDELVTLTCDLVRFPTVNPPGDAYAPCAEFIAHRLQKTGYEAKLFVADGQPVLKDGRVFGRDTHDQKHIARIGHLLDCIAYGPGIRDLAHQPDEWIGIDDMAQSATVVAASIATLLTEAHEPA